MAFSTKIRDQAHQKYAGRCTYCGHKITRRAMQVDHIEASYRGGSDEMQNLNPACFACNNYKLAYSIEQLRQQIEQQVERGRLYSVNFRLAERYGLIKTTGAPVVFYFEQATAQDVSDVLRHCEREDNNCLMRDGAADE